MQIAEKDRDKTYKRHGIQTNKMTKQNRTNHMHPQQRDRSRS